MTNVENSENLNGLQENSDKIELLEYLLSFLETDNDLNHVLAGYFSKFLLLLLNKHQKIVF